VAVLGACVRDALRRAEEGLSQHRFAQTAEGLAAVGDLGAVLQLHDREVDLITYPYIDSILGVNRLGHIPLYRQQAGCEQHLYTYR